MGAPSVPVLDTRYLSCSHTDPLVGWKASSLSPELRGGEFSAQEPPRFTHAKAQAFTFPHTFGGIKEPLSRDQSCFKLSYS